MICPDRGSTIRVTPAFFCGVVYSEEINFKVEDGKKVMRDDAERDKELAKFIRKLNPRKIKSRTADFIKYIMTTGSYIVPIRRVIVETLS